MPRSDLSRRALLAAGGALAVAPVANALRANPAATAEPMLGCDEPTHYRFKLGDFEVTMVADSDACVDGPWPLIGGNTKQADVQQLMQALQVALMHESLAAESNLTGLLEEIYKALDVDADLALKSDDQKAAEAEAMSAQQDLMMQMQSLQAALTQSQVTAAEAKAALDIEKSQTEDVKQRVMQLETDLKAKELAIKAETARGQLETPKPAEGKA